MFMCEVIPVPGDFLPSSAALSMALCQGLLWAILAYIFSCCFCTSKAPLVPLLSVFLCQTPKFVAGASSCILLVWFSLGFVFVQGSLVCCSIRSWHFSDLSACNTSAGQAWEHFSCITGQEAQQSKFCGQKICSSLICIILLKTTQAVAHLLLFCLWPISIFILQVLGNRDCLVQIRASPFRGLVFARLQGCFDFLNKTGECISMDLVTELHCFNAYEHRLLTWFSKIKWNQILFPLVNMCLWN